MRFLILLKTIFYKDFLSKNRPLFGKKVKIKQPVLFLGNGKIKINDKVSLGYFPSPYFFNTYGHIEARGKNSLVEIGSKTKISNNCVIICNDGKIQIGENCRLGLNFQCINSDFHGLKKDDRDSVEILSKDILLEKDVFVGNNCIILKGVKLGAGCVVGAGSVVTKSFEANSLIAGNPAKLIKRIDND